jgi:hypothetical protein
VFRQGKIAMHERHFTAVLRQQLFDHHALEGGAIGALQVFVNHRAHGAVRPPLHDRFLREEAHG